MIPHMCKGQIISLRLYIDFLILSQAVKSESYNWQVIFTSSTPSKGPLKAIWKKAKRKVKEEKESSGLHLMNIELFRRYFGGMYGTRRVVGCQEVDLRIRIWVNEAMNCVFMMKQDVSTMSSSCLGVFVEVKRLTALKGTSHSKVRCLQPRWHLKSEWSKRNFISKNPSPILHPYKRVRLKRLREDICWRKLSVCEIVLLHHLCPQHR